MNETMRDFLLARITEDEGTGFAPARVLDECEAKRRIVTVAWAFSDDEGDAGHLARATLLHLAMPYADHPDYPGETAVATPIRPAPKAN